MLIKINRLLVSVLAAVALLSCSSKEQEGDPYILFEVHGKVIDTEANPLQGINIISGYSDVQVTKENGSFSFYGRTAPADHVLLTFEDKDGNDNGGHFINKTMEISLNQKSPGTSGNFKGTFFAAEVEVIMVSKNMEINPNPDLTPQ
jgi:putative lipoprotein (rSAM/lipoprotein system)